MDWVVRSPKAAVPSTLTWGNKPYWSQLAHISQEIYIGLGWNTEPRNIHFKWSLSKSKDDSIYNLFLGSAAPSCGNEVWSNTVAKKKKSDLTLTVVCVCVWITILGEMLAAGGEFCTPPTQTSTKMVQCHISVGRTKTFQCSNAINAGLTVNHISL